MFGVEKYKGYVETKQEHGCPVISQLYWLRYICTRDSSLIEYRIEIQDGRVQILIQASLHLLYLHFFEEGQSASKKHLSEEHLGKIRN